MPQFAARCGTCRIHRRWQTRTTFRQLRPWHVSDGDRSASFTLRAVPCCLTSMSTSGTCAGRTSHSLHSPNTKTLSQVAPSTCSNSCSLIRFHIFNTKCLWWGRDIIEGESGDINQFFKVISRNNFAELCHRVNSLSHFSKSLLIHY